MVRCYIAALGFALAMMSMGCGPGQLSTVKVSAKVFVDDKPFGPAGLSLSSPTGDKKVPNASGSVTADGTATLRTYPNGSGIVPGVYSCNLLPDPLAMNQVPIVGPISVDVKTAGESLELRFKTIAGAVPGMVPPTTDNSAPATAAPLQ